MCNHKWTLFFLILTFTQYGSQAQQIYLVGGNIVNVKDGKVEKNMTIVIEDSVIRKIEKSNPNLKIPATATVINLDGKYIMPGMIDSHIHFYQSGGLYTRPDHINVPNIYSYEKDQQWISDNREDIMRRYLACGITTVMDMGGPMSNFEVRKYCNQSPVSPNALVTGPLISTYAPPNFDKNDPPVIKVNNEEEAIGEVRRQLPFHPDYIKIWFIVSASQSAEKSLPIIKAIVEESHKNNLKVLVHATQLHTATLAVEAGCDILVHSVSDSLVEPSFIQLLKAKNTTLITTLKVREMGNEVSTQQMYFTTHDLRHANPFMLGTLFDLQHIPAKEVGFDYMDMRTKRQIPSKQDSNMLVNCKLLNDAGINIVAGTDAGNPGVEHAASYLDELIAMNQAGLTNAQVLRAATINAAKGFGIENRLGIIEENKLADLLILKNNPFENLQNLDSIYLMVHRGRLINTDSLIKQTPASIVQQQFNAYNAHDFDEFFNLYSDSIVISNGDTVFVRGKQQMRKLYQSLFTTETFLHSQLLNRMTYGNTVTDLESTEAISGKLLKHHISKGLAIYRVNKNKIDKVTLIRIERIDFPANQ
jgi:imidazolonepropionase-like amidohydrolase